MKETWQSLLYLLLSTYPITKRGGGGGGGLLYKNHCGLLSFSLSFHVHALSRRYLLNRLTSFNGVVMHDNEPVYCVKKGLAIIAVDQDIISFVNLYNLSIHFQKLLWVYCPGHARVKGNDQADRLAGKQPSQVACFFEDLKCWGAWDTACSHKAKDTTASVTRRREAWKEEALDGLP